MRTTVNDQPDEAPVHEKPMNKATMDQPQEEFIAPYAANVNRDGEDEEENQEPRRTPAVTITKD